MSLAIRILVAVIVVTPLAAQRAAPTRQDLTFSADVDVVNVFATVKDRSGRILDSLGREDFILWEDGFVQHIGYFAYETNLPLKIGLLIDTSISQSALIPAERRAGVRFFRQFLQPSRDAAFLITFGCEVELQQDYTGSLESLEGALDDLHHRPCIQHHPQYGPVVGGPVGTALYDSLFLASDEMFSNQAGRKVAVLVSDGHDSGSKVSLERAIEAAQRADVVVYSIQYLDPAFDTQLYGDRSGSGMAVLREISEQTGGGFFSVSERLRLSDVFTQIEEEMRGVYSIGYTPKRGLDEAGYRRIELTSPRMDVRAIQARDGYYAGN